MSRFCPGGDDQFVDVRASGGMVAGEWVGPRSEEEFDDGEMIGFCFVDGGPDGAAEDAAAVLISCFEGSAGVDEEFNDVFLTAICGPVEGVETGAGASAGIEVVG